MPASSTSAAEIADAVRRGARTAADVVRDTLDGIGKVNPDIGAFLSVFADHARQRAAEIDDVVRRGEDPGPLAGVPIAVKDNICFAHGPTTCGSRMLEGYRSPFTATALQRLVDAGAVVVGKTNLDEFGMGSSCEHSAFGPTRNPRDTTRVPGGSSGGSAAAVAAGLVPIALGSDTGGSVRQPAAMCGVVGLKPTYGRVSRYGLVAYASSLDQIGPLAASVDDCALTLGLMQGVDPLDATSSDRADEPNDTAISDGLKGIVLGVPTLARRAHNDTASQSVFDQSLELLRDRGAEIREIELPHAEHAVAAYYVIATAEASSNLARYDGVRYGRRASMNRGDSLDDLYTRSRTEGLGPEVRRRIMLGTHVLSSGYYDAYYLKAMRARRRVAEDYAEAFRSGCDVVVMPTTPGPAFKIGAKADNPLAMYAEDLYTVGASLAGLPAVSVPAGTVSVDERSLPLGMQLIGPAWSERRLLRRAGAVQAALHTAV